MKTSQMLKIDQFGTKSYQKFPKRFRKFPQKLQTLSKKVQNLTNGKTL